MAWKKIKSKEEKDKDKQLWDKHVHRHYRLYKDENISLEELIKNWEFYHQQAQELHNEITNCKYCEENRQFYNDTDILPEIKHLSV